jgi:cytochrome c-type biogenesis protein CcmF
MVARVIGVLGLVTWACCCLCCLHPTPLTALLPAAENGRDLNPLLQDPGLIFHPPMLYMGYVGFAVAFAFAIAALLSGRLDAAWARWSRPWTTAAWAFLTLGIALGSWWAYYELGWGGWWFWDPVENASFMPWLIGHCADAFTGRDGETRQLQKLDSAPGHRRIFSVVAGDFLVRSGVLTSVHAFATDPGAASLFWSCWWWWWVIAGAVRLARAQGGPGWEFALMSRESLMLTGNVLAGRGLCVGAAGNAVPADYRRPESGQDFGGTALLQCGFCAHHGTGAVFDGSGPVGALEEHGRQGNRFAHVDSRGTGAGGWWLIPRVMGGWTVLTVWGLALSVWIAASGVIQIARRLKSRACRPPPFGVCIWGTWHRRFCLWRHHGGELPGRAGCAHGAR